MGCRPCAETKKTKAATYVTRALALMREAQEHAPSDDNASAIMRLVEIGHLLPDVPVQPVAAARADEEATPPGVPPVFFGRLAGLSETAKQEAIAKLPQRMRNRVLEHLSNATARRP